MTSYARALESVRDRARPYLTQVAPDFRTELSVATFANGVAKAANALADEFDVQPGTDIGIRLPWHWQRAVWCAAAWWLGACVHPNDDELPLVVCDAASAVPDAIVVSLHPLGLAQPVPDGCVDGTSLVRMQPDVFLTDAGMPDAVALREDGTDFTQQELIELLDGVPTGRIAVSAHAGVLSWVAPVWLPVLDNSSVVMVADDVDAATLAAEGVSASIDG